MYFFLIVFLTIFTLGTCAIDPLPMGTLAPTAPGKSAPMLAISQSKIKQTKISKYTNSQREIDLKKVK